MVRDAEGREPVVFDLVDDDLAHDLPEVAPGHGAGDGTDGGLDGLDGLPTEAVDLASGGPWGSRLRVLATVAAVLAVAAGTGVAVDGVRAAERMERIREVPGGVADVSLPLEQTWAWEGRLGSSTLDGELLVADLAGMLTFQSGDELIALDPESGEEAWSVPLGEDPECGPASYPGPMTVLSTPSMVCLQGDAAHREVLTVGPDGAVTQPRALVAADERRYGRPRPGPEGTVLRAVRVGDESAVDLGDARCTAETGECDGTVTAGRDLRLRAEDATTGEERWTVTIPFHASVARACTSWYGPPWDGWEEVPAVDTLVPDAFGAQIGADLVDMWGCGVSAAVTPGGTLLRAGNGTSPGGTASLGGSGYLMVTAPGPGEAVTHTILFAPDGTVTGEISEYVTSPRTTDDPDGTTLLASGTSGERVRAYAVDGSLRWDVASSSQTGAPELLAQVDGTLVTGGWTSVLKGRDLDTGAERWSLEPGDALGDSFYGLGYVSQAFTDGRFVLLPLQSDDGTVELAAVDARSGQLAWNRPLADLTGSEPNSFLAAVDGHLLVVMSDGVRGLG